MPRSLRAFASAGARNFGLVCPGSVAHLGMATAAARWPVARGSAAPAPRPRPIALQAGHFMIVSSLGQIGHDAKSENISNFRYLTIEATIKV